MPSAIDRSLQPTTPITTHHSLQPVHLPSHLRRVLLHWRRGRQRGAAPPSQTGDNAITASRAETFPACHCWSSHGRSWPPPDVSRQVVNRHHPRHPSPSSRPGVLVLLSSHGRSWTAMAIFPCCGLGKTGAKKKKKKKKRRERRRRKEEEKRGKTVFIDHHKQIHSLFCMLYKHLIWWINCINPPQYFTVCTSHNKRFGR